MIGGGNGSRENNSTNSGRLAIAAPVQPSRPTARTFNMTVQDAVQSRDVVSGIIPINNIDAYVLFDSGATCSFVSVEFANRLDVPREKLEILLNIEVANKEVIPVSHVYRNCKVVIRGHQMTVDLIPIRL